MKIALISESPSVTTGFGVHANHLVHALKTLGCHDLVVFGVCAEGQPFDPAAYPCRIIPMPRDQMDALPRLPAFLAAEQPDLLLIHYDLGAVSRFLQAAREAGWQGPTIVHFVIDGIPFSPSLLATLQQVDAALTPTYAAARYCQSLGLDHVIAAPHPVDATLFQPLPNRTALRAAAGVSDRFVVGMFGRNVERKQQPRALMALQQLRAWGQAEDVLLYMHCQPTNEDPWLNSWNLPEIAERLGVADLVRFPQAGFRQLSGIPYQQPQATTAEDAPSTPNIPAAYTYVERINLCDLVLNVPYAGAFELAPIESGLCRVASAVTNDHGAMAEVAQGSWLLEPADTGIHSAGGWQHFVGAETIAKAIVALKQDRQLLANLSERCYQNAQRYASTAPLEQGLRQALAAVTTSACS
ncbi:MAG: hypothetical protein Fur005_12330 [Roseiflexaceae bacterium]